MRNTVVVLVVVATLLFATAAGASCRFGRCRPVPLLAELSVGALQLSLADRTFTGSGRPAGLDGNAIGPSMTLAADGRTLGAIKPVVSLWQVHYLWLTPWHLALGGVLGGVVGDTGRGGATVVDGQTIDSSLTGSLFGPEIDTVLAHGPLELRAGVTFGYRNLGMPITSFAKVSCGKGGRCYPTASDDQFFFEPRVSVGVDLGSVQIGGYAGGDLLPTSGWSAGGYLAVALPEWRSRAQVRPISLP